MSITDELRKWANGSTLSSWTLNELTAIADRIDAEHERVRAESIIDMTDESMAEHGWVRLPKDADGEYIRIGDVMEFSAFEVGKPPTRMVDGIGQGVFFAWCGERGYQQHEAKRYRHYLAPTVEDVLREFVSEFNRDDTELCDEEIIERFAAKLRLAGDAE